MKNEVSVDRAKRSRHSLRIPSIKLSAAPGGRHSLFSVAWCEAVFFFFSLRQRSLQYFTSFQFLAHRFRHSIGRPHFAQILIGFINPAFERRSQTIELFCLRIRGRPIVSSGFRIGKPVLWSQRAKPLCLPGFIAARVPDSLFEGGLKVSTGGGSISVN